MAVGRGPSTANLGYEEVGVAMDRGYVLTDERLRTNIPGVWAVGARKIEVVELHPDVEGETIELSAVDGERTLEVDGSRAFGRLPQLERLAEGRAEDYAVHASRLDGSLWEVRVDAL